MFMRFQSITPKHSINYWIHMVTITSWEHRWAFTIDCLCHRNNKMWNANYCNGALARIMASSSNSDNKHDILMSVCWNADSSSLLPVASPNQYGFYEYVKHEERHITILFYWCIYVYEHIVYYHIDDAFQIWANNLWNLSQSVHKSMWLFAFGCHCIFVQCFGAQLLCDIYERYLHKNLCE